MKSVKPICLAAITAITLTCCSGNPNNLSPTMPAGPEPDSPVDSIQESPSDTVESNTSQGLDTEVIIWEDDDTDHGGTAE